MPTINPRVQVTLSPSLDVLVQSLASHANSSKSQVLRELLEAAEPALRRAVALMDAASKVTQEVHTGFAQSLDHAQTRIEKSMHQAMSALDGMTGDLVSQAEAVKSRRPGRRAAPSATGGEQGAGGVVAVVAKLQDPSASKRGVKSSKALRPRAAKGVRS